MFAWYVPRWLHAFSSKIIGMPVLEHLYSRSKEPSCLTSPDLNIRKWELKLWSIIPYSTYDFKPNCLKCIIKKKKGEKEKKKGTSLVPILLGATVHHTTFWYSSVIFGIFAWSLDETFTFSLPNLEEKCSEQRDRLILFCRLWKKHMWMQWWSWVRHSPRRSRSISGLRAPQSASTVWSLSCWSNGSRLLPRKPTRYTARWEALSLSAHG